MYNLLPLPSSLPSPSSELDFLLLSRARSSHSYPGWELSLAFAVFQIHGSLVSHLFGMFRDFRHHILPCQRDGNSKPASVLLLKISWWQLDLCKSYLGLYARSRQSQHFSKYGCTPQMTGLAPFGPLSGISLARHKVTILFVPCCTNPFILLFGTSLLPSWQSHVA
jgi:hypothetical protein